jgi:hypothetical protein
LGAELAGTLAMSAQEQSEHNAAVPIYRVTVVDRTVSAVDYQYHNGPTNIDFQATVLLPMSKGGATVESKEGRTKIDAHFDHVLAPTRFGREYLTLFDICVAGGHPGRAYQESRRILAGSSDKAKLRVTTD